LIKHRKIRNPAQFSGPGFLLSHQKFLVELRQIKSIYLIPLIIASIGHPPRVHKKATTLISIYTKYSRPHILLATFFSLIIISFLAVICIPAQAAQTSRLAEFLPKVQPSELFPGANRFGELLNGPAQGDPAIVPVYRGEELLGHAFLNSDFTSSIGYSGKPIHIIGGVSIFNLFKDEVNILYRTIIEESFVGDTYMPEMDYKYFRVIDVTEGIVDEKNIYPHRFFVYERKKLMDLFN